MSNNRFFEGLFLGSILGFVGGILFAPRSGAELRKDIAENSDELYRQASHQVSDLKDRTEQSLQEFQVKGDAFVKKAASHLADLKDRTEQSLHDFQAKGDTIVKQASVQFQETKDKINNKLQDLTKKSSHVALSEPGSAQHR